MKSMLFFFGLFLVGVVVAYANCDYDYSCPLSCDCETPKAGSDPCHTDVLLCSTSTPTIVPDTSPPEYECPRGAFVDDFPHGCKSTYQPSGSGGTYKHTNCTGCMTNCWRMHDCIAVGGNCQIATGEENYGQWQNKVRKFEVCCDDDDPCGEDEDD